MKTSEKALAGATAAVLVLAFGWTQVAKPIIDDWGDARARVEKAEDQVAAAHRIIRRKKEVEAEHAQIQGALKPPKAEEGDNANTAFLAHLRSLTQAAGLKEEETSLRTVRSDPYDAFAELRFELKARAPLKQLQDFLVRMTASEWYLRVQALQLIPRDDGTIDADVSLVALATKDALEPSDEPGPGPRRPK